MKAAQDKVRWREVFKAGLVVLVIALIIDAASQLITYPTERHRQVGAEISELTWSTPGGSEMSAEAEARFDELYATPESEYSVRVGLIAGTIQTIIYIAITYYLYSHIRRNGLARKVVGAVTLVMTSVATVSAIAIWLIYSGGQFYEGGIPLSQSLIGLLFTVLAVAVVSFVVASLCESWYKRRNSFEI